MKIISVGGCGGFELGIERALGRLEEEYIQAEHAVEGLVPPPALRASTLQPFAYVDPDHAARRMMKHRYPTATGFPELAQLVYQANVKRGTIDGICGRIGINDVTIASTHKRVAPEAGRAFHLARLARHAEPSWLILEAPSDLLSSANGRRMQALLALFTGWLPGIPKGNWRSAGFAAARSARDYHVAWRRLDLRHFFAPGSLRHRREKLYFVLVRNGSPRGPVEILLDVEDLGGFSEAVEAQAIDAGVDSASAEASMRAANMRLAMPFVWRAGGFSASPIVETNEIPTIYGDNVAWALDDEKMIARLSPGEIERALTFPTLWTAYAAKGDAEKELRDTPRYIMLQTAVPPVIVEWIAYRLLKNN